jgi:hypothetical protein
MEMVGVCDTRPKFAPKMVIIDPDDGGMLRACRAVTVGESYENTFTLVPTTAVTVMPIVLNNPICLGTLHTTDVPDIHFVPRHASLETVVETMLDIWPARAEVGIAVGVLEGTPVGAEETALVGAYVAAMD